MTSECFLSNAYVHVDQYFDELSKSPIFALGAIMDFELLCTNQHTVLTALLQEKVKKVFSNGEIPFSALVKANY